MELDYMKDTDKQKKFIELRAKNYSFQRISDKIGVSKPTLFKWDKKFSHEIDTLNSIELEGLYQEYMTTTKQRVEYLGKLHQKLIKELQNRELTDVKTDKLLEMIIKTSNELEQIKSNNKLRFLTKEDIDKCKNHDKFMESLNLFP
jgi:transposase-like protein